MMTSCKLARLLIVRNFFDYLKQISLVDIYGLNHDDDVSVV